MKRFLVFFLIVFSCWVSHSQVKARFGIRAGLNSSKISNLEGSYQNDFYLGGFVAIKFSKFYVLQPELSFSRQGSKLGDYQDEFGHTNDIRIAFISNSIINKFYLSKNVHVIVGPYFDIKVFDNNWNMDYYTIDDYSYGSDTFYYDGEEATFVDTGIIFGLGYHIIPNLMLEVRYKQGFVSMFDWWNTTTSNEYLNQVFQFGLAYKFDF